MESSGDTENAESSMKSSQKSIGKEPFITHLSRSRRIFLSSQPPLPLEPASRPSQSTPRTSGPQAAAFFIANNIDLLQQILLYLPPKSLIRFQCVSKEWLSIISDPAFRLLHSRIYPSTFAATTEALFVFPWKYNNNRPELGFISLSDEYVNSMANIVSHLKSFFDGVMVDFHSCNGLLALTFKLNDYDDHREFVVYNPTTRQYRIIPKFNHSNPNVPQVNDPQVDHPQFGDPYFDDFDDFDNPQIIHVPIRRMFEGLNMVFDPAKSGHFKLVYVWRNIFYGEPWHDEPYDSCGFAVYASETGIWSESVDTVDMGPPGYIMIHFGNGVLWNGDLHWATDLNFTMCFNLDKECLRKIPSVRNLRGWRDFFYFGECNGCLYVIEDNNASGMLFDVFEMERDYSKWVLKYHIDLAPLKTLYPSVMQYRLESFGMSFLLEDKKEKKVSLVISLRDKVILYNINDEVVTELAELWLVKSVHRWKSHCYQWMDTFRHMETLAYV